ncbi:MAG TPA: DNA translocase FtsK [Clostridiales bacterium]|jgi:S-DNA-T family DNA segregation ATPase FtsK/SpoIIIE|nr:DNA translocase FtsK [Clostridiales bacterium]HCS11288.1 DNA translocase FtsK [Clostridiales bacterium]
MAKTSTNKTKKTNKKISTGKKSTSTKTSGKNVLTKEITGIFLVSFAVFMIIVAAKEAQTGIIGKSINIFTHSAFGAGSEVLPYFILAVGILRLLNIVILNDNNQIAAIIGAFLCFIIYKAVSDAEVYAQMASSQDFQELVKISSDLGILRKGGGVLGNIITFLFVKLVGKNGTYIALGALIFSLIVLLTNQSIIGILKLVTNYIKKFFNVLYRFIFTEEDKSKSKKEKSLKKQQDENIKIYDYMSPAQDNKKADITQLKIEDIQKSEKTTEASKTDPIEETKEKFRQKEITDEIITISDVKTDNYKLPSIKLLDPLPLHIRGDKEDLKKDGEKLIETLNSFSIPCNILQINKGPTITRYEIQPAPGIKVSRITALSNDIALALATSEIRMEAPIPGKAAIGIEVPNRAKTSVYLRSMIESREYKTASTNLPFALGKDIAGKNIIASIDKMPHLLIAGATGSGKSVCINSLIMSILFKAKPDEVKLILIDPKVVELSNYNGIPHLLIPVVTDPRKAANALNWAVSEMTNRYKIFAQSSVREIDSYNEKMARENKEKMAKIVIIIDELADLMTVASTEVEEYITRIAQLARACGMHLVIATQRPSVDVITGVIKANIPSRIAFAVSSHIDSRTILDTGGAEKLLGKGDMLYHPIGLPKPVRIQGTFISDDEIKRVVDYIKEQQIEIKISKQNEIIKEIENQTTTEEVDEYLEQAIETVVNDGQASVSYIQRKFRVGYSRAARIIDQLEERGIVGGHEGSKPRKVLISKEELDEMRGN